MRPKLPRKIRKLEMGKSQKISQPSEPSQPAQPSQPEPSQPAQPSQPESSQPFAEKELARVHLNSLTIGEELGRGGLAVVVNAMYQGQRMAAKLWRPREKMLPTQELEDRMSLLKEAELLNVLRHPNVVEIAAVVQNEGLVDGILLEVLGPSLQAEASNLQFAPDLKAALRDVSSALVFMHSLLIAHNDLKAQNVAVSFNQPPIFKVIDMDAWLKVANESTPCFFSPGTRVGCCPYAEQANWHFPLKSDAYSVGRMLSDLLLEMAQMHHAMRTLAASLPSIASVISAVRPLLRRPEDRGSLAKVPPSREK
jgi:serine/threonine protein kinase